MVTVSKLLLTGVIIGAMLTSFAGFWFGLSSNPSYSTANYQNLSNLESFKSISNDAAVVNQTASTFILAARNLGSGDPGTIVFSVLSLIATGLLTLVRGIVGVVVIYVDMGTIVFGIFNKYVDISPLLSVIWVVISVTAFMTIWSWIGAHKDE